MSAKTKPMALGRGLNAIFDIEDLAARKEESKKDTSVIEMEIDRIEPNPNQPRQTFDEALIDELAQSIATLGLIQPITVREEPDGRYVIISGERRYRASKKAGLTSVPVFVRKVDDVVMLEMSLVENIQREDLNAIEVACTLSRLIDECGITQEKLSERVGKNRSTIANYIRLLRLPPEIQLALQTNLISMGHARALLSIESPERQIEVLKAIVHNALSVRQVEKIAQETATGSDAKRPVTEAALPESYRRLSDKLEHFFNRKISVKRGNKGDGTIVIRFKNEAEIEDLIKKLEK